MFEMLPGVLTWGTFILAVVLSYYHPTWVAVYIIIFDLYWMFKAVNIGIHLVYSYRVLASRRSVDWLKRCHRLKDMELLITELELKMAKTKGIAADDLKREIASLKAVRDTEKTRSMDFDEVIHVVILPMVHEPYDVISHSLESYLATDYPKDKMIFVLATEERAGAHAAAVAALAKKNYADRFGGFFITVHPDGIEGEAKTKGANTSWAARQVRSELEERGIDLKRALVSAFDADTAVQPSYFSQLTYTFLTTPDRLHASYQPIALYHNNVWDTPAMNRIAAVSNSFWLMLESSRPDRLVTFSSHSMSFQTLVEVGYWPTDVVPEDSQIFWRCFLHYDGNYRVVPLYATVSLDAVALDSYVNSLIGQYKQYRRWAWGVVDIPYVLNGFLKNNRIPFWKRFVYVWRLISGHYSWATAAFTIALLGWLPLLLGGGKFENQVFALNLPHATGFIMTVAMSFLIFSVIVNTLMLPDRPRHYSRWRSVSMMLQWLLVPIASILIHGLPAVDAQTRLLFGRYMEFWVTPKNRTPTVKEPLNVA